MTQQHAFLSKEKPYRDIYQYVPLIRINDLYRYFDVCIYV